MASGAAIRRAIFDDASPIGLLARIVIVTGAYFLGAKLGLQLAFANENVTSVWPPTGIAVASLVLFGSRVWPGIAAGAFLANLSNEAPLVAALGITIGNTIAPVIAAVVLRVAGFRSSLDRVRDVLSLVFLAGLASMLLSATGGTTTLAATGNIGSGGYGETWLTWWLGDALGVVIYAPFLLLFFSPDADLRPFHSRPLEAVVLFAGTGVAAFFAFNTEVRVSAVLIPLGIWGALRFYQHGASAVSVLLSSIAIAQTVAGRGPFTAMSQTTNLLSLQAFNSTVAISALLLAALTRERQVAQDALRDAAADLEERVTTRTGQLARSEERMSEAQALAHIGSWYWDVATNAVSWTDELYRIYGLEPQVATATFEGYVGRVHADHREQVKEAVRATLDSGEAFDHEYRIVRPNGEVRWVHARGEVVADRVTGETVGLRGFCHDITHQKAAQDALRDALEGERETARRLRLLDEFKDSLLTAVSHELRTPLTVIIGLASTLRNTDIELSPDDLRELVRRLEANAYRLDSLLMDLLDIDRLNRHVIEPLPRAIGLQPVVLRVLDMLEAPNHTVDCDLGSAVVSVDPAHLERIVENLVANAVRHTPPGTPIWIRAEDSPDGVVVVVEDAGPGVPPALRAEVFEPFRRGDGNAHAPGIGVGLALVARFATLNGGRAWLEDRPGGGASFRVLLPAGASEPESSAERSA